MNISKEKAQTKLEWLNSHPLTCKGSKFMYNKEESCIVTNKIGFLSVSKIKDEITSKKNPLPMILL